MRPGPTVQATASMRRSSTPASTMARAITGLSSSRWARLAISGTTPPYGTWRSICELTTLDTTSLPPITSAAAVSSQLVSMPSTSVSGPASPRRAGRARRCVVGHAASSRGQALGVGGRLDVVAPHDDGVLGALVVLRPDPGGREAERAVQRLGAGAAGPHLERPRQAPARRWRRRRARRADRVAMPPRRWSGWTAMFVTWASSADEHQPAVADDGPPGAGHEVVAVAGCRPGRARRGTRSSSTASGTTPARCRGRCGDVAPAHRLDDEAAVLGRGRGTAASMLTARAAAPARWPGSTS